MTIKWDHPYWHVHHKHMHQARKLEALALCHKVIADDVQAATVADVVAEFQGEGGLNGFDAAMQALRHGDGNIARAAQAARARALADLRVMGAARTLREHGLILVDYFCETNDSGDSASHSFTVALRDRPARARLADVLERACRAGVVDYEGTHCQHAHDCCGHWYHSGARGERLSRNLFLVGQSYYQNV